MNRDFALVTYVPFYRFHEVIKWQLLNAKRLGVDYVTAYVDNVFAKEQVDLLELIVDRFNEKVNIVPGNWRSRCGTWFSIIRDHMQLDKPFVVIDSDNEVTEPDKVSKFIDWVVNEDIPIGGSRHHGFGERQGHTNAVPSEDKLRGGGRGRHEDWVLRDLQARPAW